MSLTFDVRAGREHRLCRWRAYGTSSATAGGSFWPLWLGRRGFLWQCGLAPCSWSSGTRPAQHSRQGSVSAVIHSDTTGNPLFPQPRDRPVLLRNTKGQSAPECPLGGSQVLFFSCQERDFWHLGTFYRPMGMSPTDAFSTPPKSLVTRRSAHQKRQICPPPKKNRPVESNQRPPRRPQPITMGSETMDLTVPLN